MLRKRVESQLMTNALLYCLELHSHMFVYQQLIFAGIGTKTSQRCYLRKWYVLWCVLCSALILSAEKEGIC